MVVSTAFSLVYFLSHRSGSKLERVHASVQEGIDSMAYWYEKEWLPAVKSGNATAIQGSFLRGRVLYKKVEWAVEFFFPATAKDLNGAPLPEIEVEEHIVIPPSGFQVLEELVYPVDPLQKETLEQESAKWRSVLHRLQSLWGTVAFRDDQVWTAIRLQLMRITALGLSGFDTPLGLSAIREIPATLKSVQEVLELYIDRREYSSLKERFEDAYTFLEVDNDFSSFNRADFITAHLIPLATALLHHQQDLGIKVQNIYALNLEVPHFFSEGAFNTNFFTPEESAFINGEKIALGKVLFHDPVLSFSQKVSCASCHRQEQFFTDGLVKSKSFGVGDLKRNTPTLLYAGLQQNQFYDMRAGFLEDQVKNVVENKDEIHGSLAVAVQRLSQQDKYVRLFNKAFNNQADSVTEWQVQVSLAAYIRSLNPFNSAFDLFLKGQADFTATERLGFNLFMGKAKCGTCHFLPLFNGTSPPMFTTTESEVVGTPADKAFSRIDEDLGRYHVYQLKELRSAFKTPTLRNIAQTAPYMHNGVFQTLEEVIDFYNEGGAEGLQHQLENQTLPPDKLKLTAEEKRGLIAFLVTLSDTLP